MGFFDDFGKKISSAGQEAIAKTKELADIAKINSSISDEENKIKTAYSEIGKKYFENHSEDSEEDYEAQIAVIKEAMEKIKAYEQQIVEIKGVVKCPNCGAENSKTAASCATCGTALPVPVTESVEATVASGDVIGRAVYKLGDRELGTVDILCSEDIAAAVYKDYFMESLQMYLP